MGNVVVPEVTDHLATLRDEVLRKIGRNVVNFQKMEGMLKRMNAVMSVSGSMSDFARIAAAASKSVARQPMGRLADAFAKSVYSGAKELPAQDSDGREALLSFTFRIEANATVAKERRRALRSVVEERNRLIHKWLAAFDPNSNESCIALRDALDQQHAKIWPEFEELRSVVVALSDAREELLRHIASDEFLAQLQAI